MNEPIQHLCGLLDEVRLVGVVLQLIVRLQVQDHVQGLPVVRHLAGEVIADAGEVIADAGDAGEQTKITPELGSFGSVLVVDLLTPPHFREACCAYLMF